MYVFVMDSLDSFFHMTDDDDEKKPGRPPVTRRCTWLGVMMARPHTRGVNTDTRGRLLLF